MSLRFLARLSTTPLPYAAQDALEALHIDVLQRAGLVVADGAGRCPASPATVHTITPLGLQVLEDARLAGAFD